MLAMLIEDLLFSVAGQYGDLTPVILDICSVLMKSCQAHQIIS